MPTGANAERSAQRVVPIQGGSPEVIVRDARAFGPWGKADVAHQVGRQVARQAPQGAPMMGLREPKNREEHLAILSGSEADRGAQLRAQIFGRSIDEACAGVLDNQGGNRVDLSPPGVTAILFDVSGGGRVSETP